MQKCGYSSWGRGSLRLSLGVRTALPLPRGEAVFVFASRGRRSRKEVENGSTFLLSRGQFQVTGLHLPSPRDRPVSPKFQWK